VKENTMDPTNPNDVALKALSDATSKAYETAKAAEDAAKGVSPTGEAKLVFPPWVAYLGAALAAASGAVLALPSAGVSVPAALTIAAAIIGPTLGGLGIVSAGARVK
jgi:hypothetical protein